MYLAALSRALSSPALSTGSAWSPPVHPNTSIHLKLHLTPSMPELAYDPPCFTWRSVQLRLLPVSDDFRPYCEDVFAEARNAGVRVEIDQGARTPLHVESRLLCCAQLQICASL